MCIACTLYAPIAYNKILEVVVSFTYTVVSLFIRLYLYTFKWCCRKINVEHGDDQLNAAEHIENAVLRLFLTMFHRYVCAIFLR